ncbi:hypothetical protein CPB85DRAFT_891693 [Mucidula mucida]|nr:hypothetical protein CPB85DRAFT_891693 [Mucidula mucida]
MAISCGWALRYGWVLWSLDCSGCCILGFSRLGGWDMTRKRLGGCHMDDRHGSRESFKGKAVLAGTTPHQVFTCSLLRLNDLALRILVIPRTSLKSNSSAELMIFQYRKTTRGNFLDSSDRLPRTLYNSLDRLSPPLCPPPLLSRPTPECQILTLGRSRSGPFPVH